MPDIISSEAQQLCDLFTKLAGEVDAYRNAHYDELTPAQRAKLEEQIQELYDFHDRFAGDVIQDTLDALQGDLTTLTSVTQQAIDALKHLNSVAKAINIVSAAANVAEAIFGGGYGQIPDAVRELVQAIQTPSDKSGTGA
jgi:hypothetical protein